MIQGPDMDLIQHTIGRAPGDDRVMTAMIGIGLSIGGRTE
jgi:hypothetical protein